MFHGRFVSRRDGLNHDFRHPHARRANRQSPGRRLRLEPLEERQMLSFGNVLQTLPGIGVSVTGARDLATFRLQDAFHQEQCLQHRHVASAGSVAVPLPAGRPHRTTNKSPGQGSRRENRRCSF